LNRVIGPALCSGALGILRALHLSEEEAAVVLA
jgi:hypothetical protein